MHQSPRPNSSYIQASRVTGTPVYNPEGEKLGSIEDIVLSKVEGEAVYAVLSFGGFLGIGHDHYPLPWSILNYDTGRDGYVVNLTREQLDGAPSYAAGSEPDWHDPGYGTKVRDHYGRSAILPVGDEVRR